MGPPVSLGSVGTRAVPQQNTKPVCERGALPHAFVPCEYPLTSRFGLLP